LVLSNQVHFIARLGPQGLSLLTVLADPTKLPCPLPTPRQLQTLLST
jgi:hypothetical protein